MLEVIEAIVFPTVGGQCSLWESVPPEKLLRLPEELARVDALLDDPAFFAPFVPFFATGKRIRAAGGAVRTRVRDGSRAARAARA